MTIEKSRKHENTNLQALLETEFPQINLIRQEIGCCSISRPPLIASKKVRFNVEEANLIFFDIQEGEHKRLADFKWPRAQQVKFSDGTFDWIAPDESLDQSPYDCPINREAFHPVRFSFSDSELDSFSPESPRPSTPKTPSPQKKNNEKKLSPGLSPSPKKPSLKP